MPGKANGGLIEGDLSTAQATIFEVNSNLELWTSILEMDEMQE